MGTLTTGGEALLDAAAADRTDPGQEKDIAGAMTRAAGVSWPRVSVVVPAYNNALHIDAAIHSILSQTYTDFELIVSDHSSTDGTWERLQIFASDRRIRLMRLPRGGGAPANWDAVTQQAKGELNQPGGSSVGEHIGW